MTRDLDDRGEPIDDERRDVDRLLRGLAEMVQRELTRADMPRERTGFGIFVFDFTATVADAAAGQRMAWISNANRASMIDALREWIRVQEARGIVGQSQIN